MLEGKLGGHYNFRVVVPHSKTAFPTSVNDALS